MDKLSIINNLLSSSIVILNTWGTVLGGILMMLLATDSFNSCEQKKSNFNLFLHCFVEVQQKVSSFVNEGGKTLITFHFTVNEGQAGITGSCHLRELCSLAFLQGMPGKLSSHQVI